MWLPHLTNCVLVLLECWTRLDVVWGSCMSCSSQILVSNHCTYYIILLSSMDGGEYPLACVVRRNVQGHVGGKGLPRSCSTNFHFSLICEKPFSLLSPNFHWTLHLCCYYVAEPSHFHPKLADFWTVQQFNGSAEAIEEHGHLRPESPYLMGLVELRQFNPLPSRCSRDYWWTLKMRPNTILKTGRCGFHPSYTASLSDVWHAKAPIPTISSCPSISSLWVIELHRITVNSELQRSKTQHLWKFRSILSCSKLLTYLCYFMIMPPKSPEVLWRWFPSSTMCAGPASQCHELGFTMEAFWLADKARLGSNQHGAMDFQASLLTAFCRNLDVRTLR